MRITANEKQAIIETAKEVFGKCCNVYLFGSRVDDFKKGGDIDLYIIPNSKDKDFKPIETKINFLIKLKRKIGEQKIDAIISKNFERPIEREAITKGIKLS